MEELVRCVLMTALASILVAHASSSYRGSAVTPRAGAVLDRIKSTGVIQGRH